MSFDCGVSSLNEWLHRRALKNESSHGSRTYVVCETHRVVGYYALAAGSIARREAPGRIKRNMPEPIPALILGRLAVDHRYQGQGVGQGLLKNAVCRAITVSRQVGVRVLIVHVLSDRAKTFYLKHGFINSPLTPDTLILPITLPDSK